MGTVQRVAERPPRHVHRRPRKLVVPPRAVDPGPTERIHLIEFLWTSPTGVQPVLMLERELLD